MPGKKRKVPDKPSATSSEKRTRLDGDDATHASSEVGVVDTEQGSAKRRSTRLITSIPNYSTQRKSTASSTSSNPKLSDAHEDTATEVKPAKRGRGRPPKVKQTTKHHVEITLPLRRTPTEDEESESAEEKPTKLKKKGKGATKKSRNGGTSKAAEPSHLSRDSLEDTRPATTLTSALPHDETHLKDSINNEVQYWLLKAEPESRIEKGRDVRFSIDDLAARTEPEAWDGVRNLVARNNMRSMLKNDLAFFYHSNCKTPGVAGMMRIVREHSIDESAFDEDHPYHDPKSSRDKPKWVVVHVEFVKKFDRYVSLHELRKYAGQGGELESMQMLKQSRLSVSNVQPREWFFILSELAGEAANTGHLLSSADINSYDDGGIEVDDTTHDMANTQADPDLPISNNAVTATANGEEKGVNRLMTTNNGHESSSTVDTPSTPTTTAKKAGKRVTMANGV